MEVSNFPMHVAEVLMPLCHRHPAELSFSKTFSFGLTKEDELKSNEKFKQWKDTQQWTVVLGIGLKNEIDSRFTLSFN